MKHTGIAAAILLASLVSGHGLSAQDTLQYHCDSYMLPEADTLCNPNAIVLNSINIFTTSPFARWVMKYITCAPTTVYGVAITYDTYDNSHDTMLSNALFAPALFVNRATQWPMDSLSREVFDNNTCQDLEMLERVFSSDSGVLRKDVSFLYEYDYPAAGSKEVKSVEFYFNTPRLVKDTFYVGCLPDEDHFDYDKLIGDEKAGTILYKMNKFHLDGLVQLVDDSVEDNGLYCLFADYKLFSNNYKEWFGEAIGLSKNGTGCPENTTKDSSHRFAYCGGFIPIVGLRCTPVKSIRKVSQGKGWAWVDWKPFDDEGTTYDVRAWQYSVAAPGDTAVLWDTLFTTTDTAQLFEGLALGGNYTVRLRKSCRYATPGYDTTVHSPWSEPLHFQIDTYDWEGVDELPQQDFGLLPNPAHGTVTLALRQRTAQGGHVEVADALGRTLLRQPLPPDTDALTLDIARLPAGTYLVKLLTPQGIASRRLMVR